MPARRRHSLAAALLLAAVACSQPKPAPPADVQTYTNFTLIDGTERVPVAGAAMVVDLAGAYVMPGLINTHGHVGNVQVESQLKTYA